MLSGLSNLLFGSGASDDVAVDQTQASQGVDLQTQEGEMGWVLVDVPEASSSVPGKNENVAVISRVLEEGEKDESPRHQRHLCTCARNFTSPMYSVDFCRCGPVDGEGQSDSDRDNLDVAMELHESMPSRRLYNLLGESWILTPPPCFTDTAGVSQLESSPLENLLIEHPSMSVYRHCRLRLQEDQVDEEEEKEQAYEQQENQTESNHRGQPDQRPLSSNSSNIAQSPHAARAARACVAAVEQMKQLHSKQRVQQSAAARQLSRSFLERSNKARMVQSSSRKHLSAHNRATRPSCRMNGRRSQRMH